MSAAGAVLVRRRREMWKDHSLRHAPRDTSLGGEAFQVPSRSAFARTRYALNRSSSRTALNHAQTCGEFKANQSLSYPKVLA